MDKRKKPEQYTKVVDETIKLPNKQGNGILRYTASTDKNGVIARYNLAYINHNIFREDNGRVLGYDNSHGYHHRHLMGKEEKVSFNTFEEITDIFEAEWRKIHEKHQK